MAEQETMTFEEWVEAVDRVTQREVGLSVHDLPDQPFRDAFQSDVTPEEFFDDTLRGELEDLGFRLEILDILEEPTLMAMEKQCLDLFGDVTVLDPDTAEEAF